MRAALPFFRCCVAAAVSTLSFRLSSARWPPLFSSSSLTPSLSISGLPFPLLCPSPPSLLCRPPPHLPHRLFPRFLHTNSPLRSGREPTPHPRPISPSHFLRRPIPRREHLPHPRQSPRRGRQLIIHWCACVCVCCAVGWLHQGVGGQGRHSLFGGDCASVEGLRSCGGGGGRNVRSGPEEGREAPARPPHYHEGSPGACTFNNLPKRKERKVHT